MSLPPPIFYLALAYAAGVGSWPFTPPGPLTPALMAAALAALVKLRRRRVQSFALLIVVFFLAGSGLALLARNHPSRLLVSKLAREERLARIEGRSVGEPKVFGTSAYFDVQLSGLTLGKRWLSVEFPVRVKVRTSSRLPAVGDQVVLRGRFYGPEEQPARFIGLVVARRKAGLSFGEARRLAFSTMAKGVLPARQADILTAIVLGGQGNEETKDNFARSGIAHLFAVSGLNVAIAAAFLTAVGLGLGFRRGTAMLLSLGSVFAYFIVVGTTPSVARAVIMISLSISAWIGARPYSLLGALSAASLLLLTIDPNWVYSYSFWLSFTAVAGIGFIAPRVIGIFHSSLKWVVTPLAVTLAAQAATAPIIAAMGGEIAPIGLLANTLVGPLVVIITVLGLVSLFTSLVFPPAAVFFLRTAAPFVLALDGAARYFASFSFSSFGSAPWSPSSVILFYLVLVGSCAALGLRRNRLGWKALLLVPATMVGAVLLLSLFSYKLSGPLQVRFLDVGQGDAVFVREKYTGSTILIDGGPDPHAVSRRLRQLGVRQIDLVILTHPHADHVAGLTEVVGRFRIGMVVDPGFKYKSSIYRRFLERVRSLRLRFRRVSRGERVKMGKISVMFFLPEASFIRYSSSDPNNNSVVARLTYGRFSLFLPGDIETEAIAKLLRRRPYVLSSVLKVAHHGSRTGTTEALYRAVKPKEAVISVGKGNFYGHPHRSALAVLRRHNVTVHRTDQNGEVILDTDGRRFRIRHTGARR